MIKGRELILGLVGIVGVFLILEGFFRGGRIISPSFTDYVEGIGRVRRANLDFVMFGEGFSIGEFNKGRYLGPYYAPEKDTGVFRICLLGDSFVEGFQVFDRNHFRKYMEDELEDLINKPCEVLNFGRSGFDLEDMIGYYFTLVKDFNPDFIMVVLSKADFQSKVTDQLIPAIKMVGDTIELYTSASESYLNQYLQFKDLTYYSTILNMTGNCYKQHRQGLTMQKFFGKFYIGSKSDQDQESNPTDASRIVYDESRIEDLIQYTSRFTKFVLVNRDTYDFPTELKKVLVQNQIDIINLKMPLDSLFNQGINPYYWNVTKQTGHWNHIAHEVVGLYLADQVSSLFANSEIN